MRANLNCLDEPVSSTTIRSMRERMDLLEEENRQLRAAAKIRARREGIDRVREMERQVARLEQQVAEKTAEAERLCAQYLAGTPSGQGQLSTMLRRDWKLSERAAAFLECLYGHPSFVSIETLQASVVGPGETISAVALRVLAHHTRERVAGRRVEVVTRYRHGYSLSEDSRAALQNALAAFLVRRAA